MFDTINGIPLHPLVVHGVVVLLPLAILGTILIAVRPRWRTRYGPLVVGSALLATVLCPIATSSGESLEERVGDVGDHAELGDQLVWFALLLVITSAALVYLEWRSERSVLTDGGGRPTALQLRIVAGVAVVAALACGVQVYRVGDSGAREAWGDASSQIVIPAGR
ncbi:MULTISPECIES: DUF2231 domain-containing protein [unclassified Nocardioides]|uniref:DUF2231 domain-containing protein n=1 Tax=unclassified Nocardioides TaxID=2615069 RepID=UPI0009F0299D|nr:MULTISPECIES: DUF2231 domain-containing protein [unclassified Nocardioides]GAW49900.1 Xylose isomerase [Nocardioides sp. PD653-B2]GAW56007.1 Xylose isomerase [Nocardioides sp. PD653]